MGANRANGANRKPGIFVGGGCQAGAVFNSTNKIQSADCLFHSMKS